MARYRKKPVMIEAFRWTGGPDQVEDPVWITSAIARGEVIIVPARFELVIRTREGDLRAKPGNFIIRGVRGELYPCKPDIFAATYEPA